MYLAVFTANVKSTSPRNYVRIHMYNKAIELLNNMLYNAMEFNLLTFYD